MTAAEYLQARGWVPCDPAWLAADYTRSETWCDPLRSGSDDADDDTGQWWLVNHALTVQRARDEEKAREAWVAFAAAQVGMVGSNGDGAPDALYSLAGVAHLSDKLLALYRARFCPEVES